MCLCGVSDVVLRAHWKVDRLNRTAEQSPERLAVWQGWWSEGRMKSSDEGVRVSQLEWASGDEEGGVDEVLRACL